MHYVRAVASRVGQLVVVLLSVTLAVFILTQVAPGDAARIRLGPRASAQAVAELRHQLGLDRSLPEQYFGYLGRLLRGDLGTSVNGRPVTDIIVQGIGPTMWLFLGTLVLSVVGAIGLAWLAAAKRDGGFDHGLRLLLLLSLFLPTFWVGFLLLRFVAIPTGWFPVGGLGDDPGSLTLSLVLPSIAGAIALAPILARSLRSSLIEVLDSDYVAVARSLGIHGRTLFTRHVFRNAAGPVVTLLALNAAYLLFGVVILEWTFGIGGLGSALVTASTTQDVYVVQGITLLFAIGVVAANLIGELLSDALDPRGAQS